MGNEKREDIYDRSKAFLYNVSIIYFSVFVGNL